MKRLTLDELDIEPEERAELEILDAHLKDFLEEIKHKPEVATQFLQDIGLLDADGNRVKLPGEEHLHLKGNGVAQGECQ